MAEGRMVNICHGGPASSVGGDSYPQAVDNPPTLEKIMDLDRRFSDIDEKILEYDRIISRISDESEISSLKLTRMDKKLIDYEEEMGSLHSHLNEVYTDIEHLIDAEKTGDRLSKKLDELIDAVKAKSLDISVNPKIDMPEMGPVHFKFELSKKAVATLLLIFAVSVLYHVWFHVKHG